MAHVERSEGDSESTISLENQSMGQIRLLPVSSNLKDGARVTQTYIWSLSAFHIIAQADTPIVEEMLATINSMVSDNALYMPETEPEIGKLMIGPYHKDSNNYRVKIIGIEGEFVDVLFVDLGDTERIAYMDLYEIPFDLRDTPIYGIIYRIRDVPKSARQYISPRVLDHLDVTHEDGMIHIDSQDEDYAWSGTFLSKHGPSWSEIIARVIYSLGHGMTLPNRWNPWSLEACQVLNLSNSNEPHLHIPNIQKLFGQEFLVNFAYLSYSKYKENVSDYQKTVLKNQVWSDKIMSFYYHKSDIPPVSLPTGSRIDVRVNFFHDVDEWGAAIVSEPYTTYRHSLCGMLKRFCEKFILRRDARFFRPVPGQVCFVCVPTWACIDRMMTTEKGVGKWKRRINRRSEEDDKYAGMWFRGEMIGHCGETKSTSICFEFYLIDLGRFVPIEKSKIVPAVLRYIAIPKMAILGCFSTAFSGRKHATQQYWYDRIPLGSTIACTVLQSDIRGWTYVSLPPMVEATIRASLPEKKSEDQEYKYVGKISETSSYSLQFT